MSPYRFSRFLELNLLPPGSIADESCLNNISSLAKTDSLLSFRTHPPFSKDIVPHSYITFFLRIYHSVSDKSQETADNICYLRKNKL